MSSKLIKWSLVCIAVGILLLLAGLAIRGTDSSKVVLSMAGVISALGFHLALMKARSDLFFP